MTRFLTEADHSRLRDAMQRLYRVEAALAKLQGNRTQGSERRDDAGFVIPVSRIPAASVVSGSIVAPASGDATMYRYFTDSPSVRFDKVSADRGKIKLHNMHKGMWLWPNVVYRCVRDHHSGLWFAVHSDLWFKGRPTSTIAAGASGTMQVYLNNSPVSGLTVPSVRHDWMAGTNAVTTSIDCVCQWFDAEDAWTIINAKCP